METDYDLKFEDMKKYIPFLESMIKKLESSGSGTGNPRQAQLSKIKALRDLLLDKTKRMKMENLQKCEQVLINLYAKVESKDTLPGIQMAPGSVTVSPSGEKSPLNSARRKLKEVSLTHSTFDDTLPEIARANQAEVDCTPGSKEPALFQRRPNKPGDSPNSSFSNSKRNYTRVLMSPPPKSSQQHWSPSHNAAENPLFQRRSPKKSPYKKERKKSKKDASRSRKNANNNLNITLKVPQERLDSLQTDDLMNRIINCDNADVDIGTLRDLRSQILGELKHTGANEDISDLLINFNRKKKQSKVDVEEGELSDSESEAIENIYGSLVIVDDDKISKVTDLMPVADKNTSSNMEQRKIQIRLVVSDNDKKNQRNDKIAPKTGKTNDELQLNLPQKVEGMIGKNKTEHLEETVPQLKSKQFESPFNDFDLSTNYFSKSEKSKIESVDKNKIKESIDEAYVEHSCDKQKNVNDTDEQKMDTHKTDVFEQNDNLSRKDDKDKNKKQITEKAENKANFYKPLAAPETTVKSKKDSSALKITEDHQKETSDILDSHNSSSSQIPFLSDPSSSKISKLNVEDKKDSVTEIDILQALKNEILSETIAIPGADNVTPALHQPKILTKVTNAHEITVKKKISLENYKKKSVSMQKSGTVKEHKIFLSKTNDDPTLKPSRGLTAKEFERFNLAGLPIDSDSSEDEENKAGSIESVYKDLAPKSPEYEILSDKGSESPIIIPEEPLKAQTNVSKSDIDMRVLPVITKDSKSQENLSNIPKSLDLKFTESKTPRPVDPRIRKDIETNSSNLSGTLRPPLNFPNMTPNRTAIMTPNARTFNLTPSHNFELDDQSMNKKHVYAPLVPSSESCDRDNSVPKDGSNIRSDSDESRSSFVLNSSGRSYNDRNPQISRDENVTPRFNRDQFQQKPRDPRLNQERRDGLLEYPSTPSQHFGRGIRSTPCHPFSRSDGSVTPLHPFGRSEVASSSQYVSGESTSGHPIGRSDIPKTPSHSFGRSEYTSNQSFSRSDCPNTPSHPFGRSDCPSTPSHPFGRSDCPSTPSHPFGRSDCPSTPSHPFGRSDCPSTPSHPFGRSDCPSTPSHPFGRSDCPSTPSHPFGRTDCPSTPSHPFGRSDCPSTPSHTFGRSECPLTPSHPFGRGGYQQDSRRNGKHYSEFDDDRGYYKNHSSNYNRNQYYDKYKNSYSGTTEPFQRYDRDKSVGRNENSRFIREKSIPRDENRFIREASVGQNYKEHTYRQEKSVGLLEVPFDKNKSRNMSHDFRHGRGASREVCNRRDRSVGRAMPDEQEFNRSSRDDSETPVDRTVFVESHAGRTFTINTSINTTFQAFNPDNATELFDARRKRATSVGRTVSNESNVRSILPEVITQLKMNRNRSNFIRAKSVGRDLPEASSERSFNDIKADFESFKSNNVKQKAPKSPKLKADNSNKCTKNPVTEKKTVNNMQINQTVKSLSHEAPKPQRPLKHPRSRRAKFDEQKNTNAYSPRKNLKDPRIRRDNASPSIKSTESNSPDRRKSDLEKKISVMVYTNDNIAKGNVLGPGAGVKNYKIPKIKRPPEENVDKFSDDSISQTFEEIKKDKMSQENKTAQAESKLVKKDENARNKTSKSKKDDKMSKAGRTLKPKSSVISSDDDRSSPIRTRRIRKAVVQDSDSEDEFKGKVAEIKQKDKNVKTKTNLTIESKDNEDSNSLDFSFDIPDTDMDIASDTVIDNISDLIANLDKDIDPSKSNAGFMSDLTKNDIFDNILQSLSDIDSRKLNSENVRGDSVKTHSENSDATADESMTDQNARDNEIQQEIVADEQNSAQTQQIDSIASTQEDENSVVGSTSIIEENNSNKTEESVDEKPKFGSEACSTPDSTINTDDSINLARPPQDTPDSTNQPQIDMHSDISSTHDSTEQLNKDVTIEDSRLAEAPKVNSLDSILSILKDKSKIKELLGMLDDQVDNEKLKKKLEKLSEIVSDDEEKTADNDKEITENTKDEVISQKDSILEYNKHTEKSTDSVMEKHMLSENMSSDKPEITIETVNEIIENNDSDKKPEEIKTQKTIVEEVLKENLNNDDKNVSFHSEEGGKQTDKLHASDEEDNLPIKLRSKRIVNKVIKTNAARKTKSNRAKVTKKIVKKRITRSVVQQNETSKSDIPSKKNRVHRTELHKLQEDIRDMFISNEVLNATGIRMCRLAKLVEDKNTKNSIDISPTKSNESSHKSDTEEEAMIQEKKADKIPAPIPKRQGKKRGRKPKLVKAIVTKKIEEIRPEIAKPHQKQKPGPKSKTRPQVQDDPYEFESDSVSEATSKFSEKASDNSDSDSESVDSSKSIINSDSLLVELKPKAKRKRGNWKLGVIKTKKKKPPASKTVAELSMEKGASAEPLKLIIEKPLQLPDMNCFIDKNYCFDKSINEYACRLCHYEGEAIVHHYKKQHPHYEIPLSRMSPQIAKEAINQSMTTNFQEISKGLVTKFVCRFCSMTFEKKSILEAFFWHVVSTHTGEYKQLCSECTNVKSCTFMLDIPPPPKDLKSLLMGYICGKCNYTQVSLENLKNHVSLRHNDEETEVYSISLSVMTKKTLDALKMRTRVNAPRALRSRRSNNSSTTEELNATSESDEKPSDEEKPSEEADAVALKPIAPRMQSRINFESDEIVLNHTASAVKVETDDTDKSRGDESNLGESVLDDAPSAEILTTIPANNATTDVFVNPHFKINYTESGTKEYFCCINGDTHYKTTLLISMKKHVQFKHSTDSWDGYCSVCKVIVMPLGVHNFKDCLAHLLDSHMDNFPVLEKINASPPQVEEQTPVRKPVEMNKAELHKTYINVRPMSELITETAAQPSPVEVPQDSSNVLPKIASVVSLNREVINKLTIEPPRSSPVDATISPKVIIDIKYEEAQTQVMLNKHVIVFQTMLSAAKLAHIFKCAGRYCSFTCSSVENAFLHTSTHQRVGGMDALSCAYCSFDASGNAIDLVTHVFKEHGSSKYSCASCFYRAFTSPMVEAHFLRAHGALKEGVVLSSSVHTPASETEDLLTRQEAVKYYVCHSDQVNCKFKTYTMMKFLQHFEEKHHDVTSHPCNECSYVGADLNELIRHLKTHDLSLYQCTWCIHGADSELEMLEHASVKHPNKRPQAYLRHIVETRDGSATPKFKVLPFVHISKKDPIPTASVAPSAPTEHAVREAERALELEKLIGATSTMMAELEADTRAPAAEEPELPTEVPTDPPPAPPPPAAPPFADRVTPELKIEPADDPTPTEPAVICLDSDEEEESRRPAASVIDLSDEAELIRNRALTPAPAAADAAAPTPGPAAPAPTADDEAADATQRFNWLQVFKCARCQIVLKSSAGLKRHFAACYPAAEETVPCAHCGASWRGQHQLVVEHYAREHGPLARAASYTCALCRHCETTPKDIKKHLNTVHGCAKVSFKLTPTSERPVGVHYLAEALPEAETQARGRRKRPSREAPAAPPPPAAKRRRYGPADVGALPVNQIFEEPAQCSVCSFGSKVRQNMVRHLRQHAARQDVPQIAPVNPVPHLETNEMHFDRMVNLASSSAAVHAPSPAAAPAAGAPVPAAATPAPPGAAARYPRYVPERQRYACGAKDCAYISIDETMLKHHWETLHSGSSEFRCVHCPPNQQLDTSRPLTSARILAHLKMHDARLFACSSCAFYHHQPQVLEKHSMTRHGDARFQLIRGPAAAAAAPAPPAAPPAAAAPTMDLKLWQCGLCKFKSMLRQEAVEHCSKVHRSKFQYKCAFCPWRSSGYENVTKHHETAHAGRSGDVFHFYYREGSVPDEPDGTPRWVTQQRGAPAHPEVKEERDAGTAGEVDLQLVKSEAGEAGESASVEDLCEEFGSFCSPSGLRYKCALCKIALEDTREAMQSHLYEELHYRKWACRVCAYKAFHEEGLQRHAEAEHGQRLPPLRLAPQPRLEAWVAAALQHQHDIIQENVTNLRQQTILQPAVAEVAAPATPDVPATPATPAEKPTMRELERAFGPFGAPVDMHYACPKCEFRTKDVDKMHEHLESELSKVRWSCSACADRFQHYHSAQLHCKSDHPGTAARAQEAPRHPATRAAWLAAVVQVQQLSMNYMPVTSALSDPAEETANDSLLVVRFEKNVPTPEEMEAGAGDAVEIPAKRPRRPASGDGQPDSDEDRLVIDEPPGHGKQCPHCHVVCKSNQKLHGHLLKHYDLKPYTCGYCDFNSYNTTIYKHQEKAHPGLSRFVYKTKIPAHAPTSPARARDLGRGAGGDRLVTCLHCVENMLASERDSHHRTVHPLKKPQFVTDGDHFFRCHYCETYATEAADLTVHYASSPYRHLEPRHVTYAARYIDQHSYVCKTSRCRRRFKTMDSLKMHHEALHGSSPLKFETLTSSVVFDSYVVPEKATDPQPEPGTSGLKRPLDDATASTVKRFAKKSTTKLPYHKKVAKKSTSKLPGSVDSDSGSDEEEFPFNPNDPHSADEVKTQLSEADNPTPLPAD